MALCWGIAVDLLACAEDDGSGGRVPPVKRHVGSC